MSGIVSFGKDILNDIHKSVFQACKETKGLAKYILDNGIHVEKDEDMDSSKYGKWVCPKMLNSLCMGIENSYQDLLSQISIGPIILFPADVVMGCCDCYVENPNYYENDALTISSMYYGKFDFKDLSWLLKYKSSVVGVYDTKDIGIPDYLLDYEACHIYGDNNGENYLDLLGSHKRYISSFVDNICDFLIDKIGIIDDVYLFTNDNELCKYKIRKYNADGKVVLLIYPNFYDVR